MRIAGVLVAIMVMIGVLFFSVVACCGILGSAGTSTPRPIAKADPAPETNKPSPRQPPTSPPVESSTPKKKPAVSSYDPDLEIAKQWIRSGRPEMGRLQVGAVGTVTGLQIMQVIDNSTTLCMFSDSLQTVLVRGYNTSGDVDGQRIELPLARVTGTTQYTSVLGATKTVFVLEAVKGRERAADELATIEAKERAERARQMEEIAAEEKRLAEEEAAKLREAQFRTWRSANRQFTIDARLDRYSPGKAVLEKRDGEIIDVDEKQLSDEDQAFIQEEMKRRLRGR